MLTRRNLLAVIAAMAVAGIAVPSPAAPGGISAEEAHTKASNGHLLLLDIRTPEEWKQTGVGAPAHPVSMRDPAFLQKLAALTDGDKNKPVALICAVGVRSSAMQRYLSAKGYDAVYNVSEGMLGSRAGPGWIRSGLPVRRYPE